MAHLLRQLVERRFGHELARLVGSCQKRQHLRSQSVIRSARMRNELGPFFLWKLSPVDEYLIELLPARSAHVVSPPFSFR